MMMVNLELGRRLQWSRRGGKGNGRVTVSMVCEETVSLGKKGKGKLGRKGPSSMLDNLSSKRFTTSLNLRKNLPSLIAFK